MDANKLAKLREVSYTVRKCCGNCEFGNFRLYHWGACQKHQYNHLKHTETNMGISIHLFGYCSDHEWSEEIMYPLIPYKEFAE